MTRNILRRDGQQRLRRRPLFEKIASLAHRHRTGIVALGRGPHAHRRGHREEHPVPPTAQHLPDLGGRPHAEQAAAVHDGHARRQWERLLQPVLRQKDRRAQLAVDASQNGQKIRRRDGVELARRLVENEELRLHDHDGGKAQKLLLSAGKARHLAVKPVLNAEKARHLRHAAADGRRVQPKALQPEGQLVPDLVGHGLLIHGLLHEADAARLLALGDVRERAAVEENRALARAVRREHGLELAQQRRFTAA